MTDPQDDPVGRAAAILRGDVEAQQQQLGQIDARLRALADEHAALTRQRAVVAQEITVRTLAALALRPDPAAGEARPETPTQE